MRFKVAVISTFLRQIAVLALGFFSVAYSSRVLGSRDFGLYALAMSLVMILAAIFSFGVPSAIVHFYKTLDERGERSELIAEGLFGLLVGILSPLIGYFILDAFGWRPWAASLDAGKNEIFAYYCITSLNAFLSSFLLAERKYAPYNTTQIVPAVVLVPLLFVFVREGSTWVDLLRVSCVAYLLATPVYIVHTAKIFVGVKLARPFRVSLTRIAYAANLWGANLVTTIFYRAPYLFIEAVAGAKTLGVYALAMQFAEKVWIPGRSIAAIVFPERSAYPNGMQKNGLGNVFKLVWANMAVVFAGVVVIYFAFGFLSTRIFGDSYAGAQSILLALSPGVVAWGGVIVIGAELAGRGCSGRNLIASLCALVACVLGMAAGQVFGGVGIALGVSLGYIVGFVVSMVFLSSLSRS